MAFDWQAWTKFLYGRPGYNDAREQYDVEIITPEDATWVASVHHLTPDENRGNSHIFMDILFTDSSRVRTQYLWTWLGRRGDQPAPPIPNDKSSNEMVALAMGGGQKIDVWLPGGVTVHNLHTGHADETGPKGDKWNTWGHHSFMVIFQPSPSGGPKPPDPPIPPDPEPLGLLDPPVVLRSRYNGEGHLELTIQILKETST